MFRRLLGVFKDRASEFMSCGNPKVINGSGNADTRPSGRGKDRFSDSGEVFVFHVGMRT
ncbi:protein of unknown function [uncultured Sphingopyxis sp.]|uniref:Uncharacterized protein n=1 Tax=uncultured Sphingopyxis sp. TaxID=310581 RepID=A0A1Y5PWX2_9SPHN|nr:protein of unknown function [uncultured Sphingopyxis sp.]